MSERASVLERPVLDPEADSVSDSEHERICMREGGCLAGRITMAAMLSDEVYALPAVHTLPAELQLRKFTRSVIRQRFENVGAEISERRSKMHCNQRRLRREALEAGKYALRVIMPEATLLAMAAQRTRRKFFDRQIRFIGTAAHSWPSLHLQVLPVHLVTGLEGSDIELAIPKDPAKESSLTTEPMFDGEAYMDHDPNAALRFLTHFHVLSDRALSTDQTRDYLDELVAATTARSQLHQS